VLVPAAAAVLAIGQARYDLFTAHQAGVLAHAAWVLIVTGMFVVPFLPIAITLYEGWIGRATFVAAMSTGLLALVAVPWAVDRAIRFDTNSTAPLIHIYDPLLVMVAVGAVLAFGVAARRARARAIRRTNARRMT
jgi:hypothetical protein